MELTDGDGDRRPCCQSASPSVQTLLHAFVPPSEFETSWPDDVPVQIHMMEADEWGAEDLVVAREFVDKVGNTELFLYPGKGHLFADSSLGDFDEEAAALLRQRVLVFLEDVG